jgi:hypothetical protein
MDVKICNRLCFAVVTIANGATIIFGEFNGVEIFRPGIFVPKFAARLHYCESLLTFASFNTLTGAFQAAYENDLRLATSLLSV